MQRVAHTCGGHTNAGGGAREPPAPPPGGRTARNTAFPVGLAIVLNLRAGRSPRHIGCYRVSC
eukprot:7380130-Prymnesium_polylepis.1